MKKYIPVQYCFRFQRILHRLGNMAADSKMNNRSLENVEIFKGSRRFFPTCGVRPKIHRIIRAGKEASFRLSYPANPAPVAPSGLFELVGQSDSLLPHFWSFVKGAESVQYRLMFPDYSRYISVSFEKIPQMRSCRNKATF